MFKMTFDDFRIEASMADFRMLEFLELRFSNPSKESCEVFPYQFHLVRPNGDQLDVVEAFSDDDIMEFMTSRSYKIKPEEKDPGGDLNAWRI
jgi:hypothetical protein